MNTETLEKINLDSLLQLVEKENTEKTCNSCKKRRVKVLGKHNS